MPRGRGVMLFSGAAASAARLDDRVGALPRREVEAAFAAALRRRATRRRRLGLGGS